MQAHCVTDKGVHKETPPSGASVFSGVKRTSSSLQPSLSSLATQHLQKRSGVSTLSSLSFQQSGEGKETHQKSLSFSSASCAGGSSIGDSEESSLQPSPCGPSLQSTVARPGPMHPSLSQLSSEHGVRRGPLKSSLSMLASQHLAKGRKSVEPSLSSLSLQPFADQRNTSQLTNLTSRRDIASLQTNKPTLSTVLVTKQSKASRVSPAVGPLPGEAGMGPVAERQSLGGTSQPSLSSLAAQHQQLARRSLSNAQLQATSDLSMSGTSFPSSQRHPCATAHSSGTSLGDYGHQPHSVSSLALVDRDGVMACDSSAGALQPQVVLQGEGSPRDLKAPPGFETLKVERMRSYIPKPHGLGAAKHSQLSSDDSSSASHLHAQPSLFAVTLCRNSSMQGSVQIEALHRRIVRIVSLDFDSLTQFSFSTFSPDDAIKNKRTERYN